MSVQNLTSPSPYFWTDTEQATDRLLGTYILYDDQPFYVQRVENHSDGVPRAVLVEAANVGEGRNAKTTRKRLDSPSFHRFRELPALGWVNYKTKTGRDSAVFLKRRAMRHRRHGLCVDSVLVFCFGDPIGGGYSLSSGMISYSKVAKSDRYLAACRKEFPPLEEILLNIEESSTIAYNPTFAVYRDNLGIRWLYRETERIGLFSGTDTLNLLAKKSFYKEEIMEDRTFTCTTIREF